MQILYKDKKYIQKVKFLFVCMLVFTFFMPFLLYDKADAMDGSISSISTKVTKDNIKNINTEKDVVFADGVYIYYADAQKMWSALKQTYGDELIVNDDGEEIPWKEYGTAGDKKDKDSFRQAVAFNGYAGDAITTTLEKSLILQEMELAYPIKLSELLTPLSLSLLLAYMLMELQERAEREIKSLESLLYLFLKYGIGFAIIASNEEVIRGINTIGQWFLMKVSTIEDLDWSNIYALTNYSIDGTASISIAGTTYNYTDSLINLAMHYDQSSYGAAVSQNAGAGFFGQAISNGAQTIANLILSVMCYALKITFTLRLVMLPVVYGDITASGLRGRGFGFLKGTLGEAMTMGLILAMCVLSSKISCGTGGMAVIMLPLSCIGAFQSVKSLVKEAFG